MHYFCNSHWINGQGQDPLWAVYHPGSFLSGPIFYIFFKIFSSEK